MDNLDKYSYKKNKAIVMYSYARRNKELAKLIIYSNFIVKLVVVKDDKIDSYSSHYFGDMEKIRYQFYYYIVSFLFNEKITAKTMLKRLIVLASD